MTKCTHDDVYRYSQVMPVKITVMTYANIPNMGYVCTVILGTHQVNENLVVYTVMV